MEPMINIALRAARKLPEQAEFDVWARHVTRCYQSVESIEELWHLPDGQTLRVITNPHPHGGVTYIYENVTERLDLESRYNALIRVQSESLDHLAEGVAVFGPDGRLRLCNPVSSALWKLSEDALADQMDADEQQQAWDAWNALPAGPAEGQEEEDEYDDGSVWVPPPVHTFDPSPYTAHRDFLRSASHFVSPMGYDQHSPSDWPGNATQGRDIVNASSAPDFPGESVMDAFERHSAMAASTMGYDAALPSGASGYVDPQNTIPYGTPVAVEMSDSTKRGRDDPPSSEASSVRSPPKRSTTPAPSGSGAASSQSAPAPPP